MSNNMEMTTIVSENGVSETVDKAVMNPSTTKPAPKKKFKQTDAVNCMSIASGELGMIGLKTGINYTWFGRGQVVEVEYQDLVAAVRSGKKHITEPLFIIQDKDFLTEFPQVEKKYESMYSVRDLEQVLDMSPSDIRRVIESLPDGAKDSIKHIASTKIANGTLDSVQRIKVLDEIFDTKFMLMTELFNN